MLAVFLPAPMSLAQVVGQNGLTLHSSISHPEIGEQYVLSLTSFDIPAPISKIQWFKNGTEMTEQANKTKVTLSAGNITTSIKVRATLTNGVTLEKSFTQNPYRVDLIVSADTTTPLFYKGRKLPSSGSDMHVKAVTFSNGVQISNAYSYVWKINGRTIDTGSQYGNDELTFNTNFEKEILLSVDIYTSNGTRIASESQNIPIVDPELHFYERNHLRGLSILSLSDPHIFIGDEISIRGEAYYMDTNLMQNDGFSEWKLDSKKITPVSGDTQEITLRKENSTGTSRLSFHIRNLRQLLQGVEDSITIRF